MRRRDVITTATGLAIAGATPVSALGRDDSGWTMPAKGEVEMIENSWLPMPDGVKLAIQLWLPADPKRRPAPVVLEYIPYRKRDNYRAYDMYWGAALASRGIAYARLETRGSGDSMGLLEDEYLPSEHHDAVIAIAWLAAQTWCNGSVGMRGVSWGGFSALQAAALRPPPLKAIMPMCASDMRYTDDAHYVGGVFALTGLKWAASMKVVMAGPPDPLITGDDWKAEWRRRLDATPPIAARWLSHQTNDAYWRQGSVALDWGAIACPVYVVGGLVDSYGNEIPRLLANLKVPRKGLYGPWQHGYPSPASPGPALDWAFEEVRWWRHWLMGEETGIMEEPMLRAYMPDATAAQVSPGPIPGRWVAESNWPSTRCKSRALFLANSALHETPQPAQTVTCSGAKIVGLGKVEWVPFAPTELPKDQSSDDAKSLVFDTTPLTAPLDILGSGAFKVRVSSEQPVAHIAVRICEVTPDGRSWLVTYGLLNLTHRDGHEHPSPLQPGRAYDAEVPLNFTSHRFAAGSRIRAAISESLWPLVWPSPHVATLTLDLGACQLDLPVRDPPAQEAPMPIPLVAPPPASPKSWPSLDAAAIEGEAQVTETWPQSSTEIADIGETKSGGGPNIVLRMTEGDPTSCVWKAEQNAGFARPGWVVTVKSEITISATVSDFHVEERLVATLNGEVVADKPHTSIVKRVAM
ncbi:MAG: CocE/NonD family hydrolase [Caulobacteraceae bacterium]|nr:CocE/NonD family hydrolase [Caulobacteraceae bacterium]